jgi:hypothetical protein
MESRRLHGGWLLIRSQRSDTLVLGINLSCGLLRELRIRRRHHVQVLSQTSLKIPWDESEVRLLVFNSIAVYLRTDSCF